MIRGSEREKAQGLVEYALILILVVLVAIVLLYIFGESLGNMYNNAIDTL